MTKTDQHSIIALEKFVLATRDSGYRGTSSAIAELVDNALQAHARKIDIGVKADEKVSDAPITVAVQDDGEGMDAATLRQALRFGGSSRFNDRLGTGRYGMGLPNSSLSQARRVEVYTWQRPREVLKSYLDLDEITGGAMREVPRPVRANYPAVCPPISSPTGTAIVWSRCDRLENRRPSTIARKLVSFLGRIFRYHLWRGVKITVNGEALRGVDPLFLHPKSVLAGARSFGEPMSYEMEGVRFNGGPPPVGKISVRFAELPVEDWQALPNDQKRRMGITDQPIVSIVRGDREIDRGWFFAGTKRRENYDDWWRCEIRFDPVLDERFGITHTKQEIHPTPELLEVLVKDIEMNARALNARVRQAHLSIKSRAQVAVSEERAAAEERTLAPMAPPTSAQKRQFAKTVARIPVLKKWANDSSEVRPFAITQDLIESPQFFEAVRDNGRLAVLVNRSHPFYKKLYGPLSESEDPAAVALRVKIELILLAAARSAELSGNTAARRAIDRYQADWSNTLASYLRI